jgi:hypothetical protein
MAARALQRWRAGRREISRQRDARVGGTRTSSQLRQPALMIVVLVARMNWRVSGSRSAGTERARRVLEHDQVPWNVPGPSPAKGSSLV